MKAYTSRHVGELPQQVDVNLATLERLNTQLRLNSERQLRTLEQSRQACSRRRRRWHRRSRRRSRPRTSRLEQLKRDLAQLDGFPDKHPDVRRLKDAIAALEAENRASGSAALSPEPSDRQECATLPSGVPERWRASMASCRR